MKKSLEHAADVEELRGRFQGLTSADTPRWGRMTVGEMLCHVRESYRYARKPGEAPMLPGKHPPAVTKFFALRVLSKWPENVETIPELKVGGGGIRPGEFARDWEMMMTAFGEFCGGTNYTKRHPIFGPMKHADWMRWGYLHADHHLRQFGR